MELKYPKLEKIKTIKDGRYALGLIFQTLFRFNDFNELNDSEKFTYLFLLEMTLNNDKHYREVFIKSEFLDKKINKSSRQRKRIIKSLREKGFVQTKQVPFGNGKTSTLYKVWIPEEIERRIEFSEVEREPLKLEKHIKDVDASEIRF